MNKAWKLQYKIEDWYANKTNTPIPRVRNTSKAQKPVSTDSICRTRRILSVVAVILFTPMTIYVFIDYGGMVAGTQIIPLFFMTASGITGMYVIFLDYILGERDKNLAWFFN